MDPIYNPTVYIAGPLIDGTPNVYNNSSPPFPLLSIENNDIIDIESNVLGIVEREVDLLKAYEMLTENQFLAIMRIAKKAKLKVTGHIPLSMTLFSAIDSGLNGIEHLRNLALSIASNSDELYKERLELLKNPDDLPGSDLRSQIHSKQRMKALDSIDYSKFEEAANLLASKNVWQTPTLFLYRNSSQKTFKDPSFKNELNKLPNQIKQKWIKEISETDTIIDKNSLRYSKWLEEATGKLHKKNVPFMAGTDTPIGYLIPGRSLHIELEVMVESGFSNLEAIKSATVNPAKFFGLENKEGRIKDGYKADLVILNSNPLDNIRNTQDISSVIKNGEFLSKESLDSLIYKN
jgi:imidazolonepropionase-like amidohydrolase